MNKENGLLVVVSSPSGGGKTTIIKQVIKLHPEYCYSISMTTRKMRPGEVNGRDYIFVSEKEFLNAVEHENLIEYEKVHGCYYGTPLNKLIELLDQNKVVFLDLDVYGALRLKKKFADRAVLIFLKPPDEKALVERLVKRSTETDEQIKKRLQRMPEEIKLAERFDHIIVNNELEETVLKVNKLVEQEKSKLSFLEVK